MLRGRVRTGWSLGREAFANFVQADFEGKELAMHFVLILWFVSQSAISVTSAQFERMEECQEALRSVQSEFSGANLAITVGGGCYRSSAQDG